MADVRLRTTAAAVLVVAVALVAGAVALVALVRGSVRDSLETTAEQRASALLQQARTSGPPTPDVSDDSDDDLLWQVTAPDGTVVRSAAALPDREGQVDLPGGEHPYLVVTADENGCRVAVAISLEDVDDSTAALLTPLLVGVPLLVLLVGATTWVVASRALAPVERIRREVEEITGDRLDRRVPEPESRDEIGRLARTMNRMLGRLQGSRDRQREFVADASHELRSPVAGIRQAAEVARTHPGALPDGELAATVLAESARLQRLVDQLLLLTRADDGGARRALHDVDLDDLALSEAQRLSRTGLKVDTAGVGAGRIRGDEAALAQVIRNLADNAARHATTTVAVGVRETAGAVELTVDDDGPGIPPGQRERVFERFVRLDEARARDDGGSGLGLAIVRAIVTAHGGTVSASSSQAWGGARFTVRFPR